MIFKRTSLLIYYLQIHIHWRMNFIRTCVKVHPTPCQLFLEVCSAKTQFGALAANCIVSVETYF